MNLSQFPFTETITAVVAAAIGWFTSGKMQAKTTDIDNTAKLIDLWEKANHNCQSELDEVRKEIKDLRAFYESQVLKRDSDILSLQQKVKVLENHIRKLEKA